MSKRGLGRGLSSLIPSLSQAEAPPLSLVRVDRISPNRNQPRKAFDKQSFTDLVASVKEFGLIQPIILRPTGDSFEIVAGERRWRAAKEAGLEEVPAIVKDSSDTESIEIALIENIQRENLNALEEAAAFQQLIEDFGITQAELAARVGKSRAAITNTMRLLQLPADIQKQVAGGKVSSGHARAVLSLADEGAQRRLVERIVSDELSVRQAEDVARLWKLAREPRSKKSAPPQAFKVVARKLRKMLGARVRVRATSKHARIEIDFDTVDDLERIYRKILAGADGVATSSGQSGERRQV